MHAHMVSHLVEPCLRALTQHPTLCPAGPGAVRWKQPAGCAHQVASNPVPPAPVCHPHPRPAPAVALPMSRQTVRRHARGESRHSKPLLRLLSSPTLPTGSHKPNLRRRKSTVSREQHHMNQHTKHLTRLPFLKSNTLDSAPAPHLAHAHSFFSLRCTPKFSHFLINMCGDIIITSSRTVQGL